MQKIFEGKVFDMIMRPDGLVFSYLEDIIDDQFLVKYKMVEAETGAATSTAKNVYLLAKFGNNYRNAIKIADNFITAKAINLPSGKLFICNTSGACYLLDSDGTVLWTGAILYRDEAPADIALYNNCVWASFKESGALIRFNLATMREELRIGGTRSPFSQPRGVFIAGNTAIVSNAGSNSLTKVNLDSYVVEHYYDFDSPVKSYIKVGKYEFVLLDSGIYSF